MNKLRKGDLVEIMTGKGKGQHGKIASRINATHIIVDGLFLTKKHTKPDPIKGVVGGIINKVMPINISNVQILNPESKKKDSIIFRRDENGKLARFFKSTGTIVEI